MLFASAFKGVIGSLTMWQGRAGCFDDINNVYILISRNDHRMSIRVIHSELRPCLSAFSHLRLAAMQRRAAWASRDRRPKIDVALFIAYKWNKVANH